MEPDSLDNRLRIDKISLALWNRPLVEFNTYTSKK